MANLTRKVHIYDRTLTLDFAPTNAFTGNIRDDLTHGRISRVVLEPGDMTRYEFYVIPLYGPLAPTGVPRQGEDGKPWLGYVRINGRSPNGLTSVAPFKAVSANFEPFSDNEHTRAVMAEFHNLLLEMLE